MHLTQVRPAMTRHEFWWESKIVSGDLIGISWVVLLGLYTFSPRNFTIPYLTISTYALLLPTESRDQFIALCDSLILEFNPTTTAENLIVQRMIAAQWRLFRVWNYERVGMLQESATAHAPEILTESGILHDPASRDATAFLALHGKSRAGSVVQLSETRYQRQFTEACKQLNYVRQNRALTKRAQEKPAIVGVSQNIHPGNIPPDTPGKPERYPADTRHEDKF